MKAHKYSTNLLCDFFFPMSVTKINWSVRKSYLEGNRKASAILIRIFASAYSCICTSEIVVQAANTTSCEVCLPFLLSDLFIPDVNQSENDFPQNQLHLLRLLDTRCICTILMNMTNQPIHLQGYDAERNSIHLLLCLADQNPGCYMKLHLGYQST